MGVLLMLMTIGGLILAAILLVSALIAKKTWLRNFVLAGIAVWLIFYAAMLVGFSLASQERTLGFNETKRYCGFYLDCHMHTSVSGVRTARTLGDRTAGGLFYIVKVRVTSDARREPLALTTVDAHVVDARGREYDRDLVTEERLGEQPAFEQRISPAESFEKEIVFDLPLEVAGPRLDLREGYGIDHAIEAVLVDDEDSIFHKRSFFQLTEQKADAGL